jgi:uncharacterized protein (DUF849 family)
MAAAARKVIVTCAITGSIHVPSQTPYLPVTPEQIAENAIGAANAGAAILHLHARNPETGQPTPDPEIFLQFLPRIKAETDAVINITTGGAQTMTIDERLSGPLRMKPEMCSLNMGSMNFGIFPLADRYTSWKHDWEEPYLRGTDDFIGHGRELYARMKGWIRAHHAVPAVTGAADVLLCCSPLYVSPMPQA